MSPLRSRRTPSSAAFRPSREHVLPFVTGWYAFAFALGVSWRTDWSSSGWTPTEGVLWGTDWSVPAWAPADGALLAALVAAVLAYAVASALIATRSDPIPAPSRPGVVGVFAFAIATAWAFGAWIGRGRSAFDGEILAVVLACCWPAVLGFRVAFGLLFFGMIPTVLFVPLVAAAGAVTALWQYWLAGWLAIGWRAATGETID